MIKNFFLLLKALTISTFALMLSILGSEAFEYAYEQDSSPFPESISLRVRFIAHPVEFSPDNSPKVGYRYDGVIWPEIPFYDRGTMVYSKVDLVYQGAGTYQYNDVTKTFLGKKCKGGFIRLLDTEDIIFTQTFDYQKSNIDYHVNKERTTIPVWPRGGYAGNELQDICQSFFFFGEILGGKALVPHFTILSDWHDAGYSPPFETKMKKKGKLITFVGFSNDKRPCQNLEEILKEGQIRFEYQTIQESFFITQQYQSFSHNCRQLRGSNNFDIMFIPLESSYKEYNLLEDPLDASLLSSPLVKQWLDSQRRIEEQKKITWGQTPIPGFDQTIFSFDKPDSDDEVQESRGRRHSFDASMLKMKRGIEGMDKAAKVHEERSADVARSKVKRVFSSLTAQAVRERQAELTQSYEMSRFMKYVWDGLVDFMQGSAIHPVTQQGVLNSGAGLAMGAAANINLGSKVKGNNPKPLLNKGKGSSPSVNAPDLVETQKGSLTIRPGQEWKVKIHGKAQETKTPGHRLESVKQAIRDAKDTDIDKVYLNRGYHRALDYLGLDHIRLPNNRQPDVLAVSKSNKNMRSTEVQSKSDRPWELKGRNLKVRDQLKQDGVNIKVKIQEIPSWDYINKRPK